MQWKKGYLFILKGMRQGGEGVNENLSSYSIRREKGREKLLRVELLRSDIIFP